MTVGQSDLSIRDADRRLIQALADHQVDVLIVGGVAVQYHGCREWAEVDDLDILLNADPGNVRRFLQALNSLRVAFDFSEEQLGTAGVHLRMKNPPYYTDVLTPTKGVDYGDLRARSVPASVKGTKMQIIGLEDLMTMKRDAIATATLDLQKHKKDLDCLTAL